MTEWNMPMISTIYTLCDEQPSTLQIPEPVFQNPKVKDLRTLMPSSLRMILQIWQCLYSNYFRFCLKWLLRQITGKCELQRICDGSKDGAQRTNSIEYSLEHSKSKVLNSAINILEDEVDQCVLNIINEKKINIEKDKRFQVNLRICVLQISGYRKLYLDVEDLRKQPYDCDNPQHEDQLLELWKLLMPHENLNSRITKQWGDIGFQGDDPKTDFRGMGMLGLANLLYFSRHYAEEARLLLSHSNHPKIGYSYAIVGINLTEMAYSLLKSGALKSHFYNMVPGFPRMKCFHQFYCYLVYEFDKFWFKEEPESIMHFNQYREKFHDQIKQLLRNPDVVLTL
ncbi:ELMO domain-containing protein 2 isoform 2-T2 [Discoglossus pictus]